MQRALVLIGTLAVAGLLGSCSSSKPLVAHYDKNGNFINPFPEGSYEHFTADPKYPKTYTIWRNQQVLDRTDGSNARLVISIAKQRAMLMNGDEVALDYPVSTGRKSHPTPPGKYQILEKLEEKSSTVYGKIYDAEGKVVVEDADLRTDAVPEGGKFVGAPMSYWMRLTWDGIGHHIGIVPRYPASHACIRGPRKIMPLVFSKVKVGTPVVLE